MMKDASGTVEEILILVLGNVETGQAPSAGGLNPDNGFPGDDPSCESFPVTVSLSLAAPLVPPALYCVQNMGSNALRSAEGVNPRCCRRCVRQAATSSQIRPTVRYLPSIISLLRRFIEPYLARNQPVVDCAYGYQKES